MGSKCGSIGLINKLKIYMELESSDALRFNVSYTLEAGRVQAKGYILRGQTRYDVSLDVHDLAATPENVKKIYDNKILHMIEGFQIGERISELYIEKDTISQKPIGDAGPPVSIPWVSYKEAISKRESDLKQSLPKLVEKLAEGDPLKEPLRELSRGSAPEAEQIRSFLTRYEKEINKQDSLRKALSELLRASIQLEVYAFVEPILIGSPKGISPLKERNITPITSPSPGVKKINNTSTESLQNGERSKKTSKRCALVRIFYKFFHDGNASWKQQKYEVALEQTIAAFKQPLPRRLTPPIALEELLEEMGKKESLSPLENLTKQTVEALMEVNSSQDQRKVYRKFIDSLRKALESPEYKKTVDQLNSNNQGNDYDNQGDVLAAKILLDLCLIRFSENKMFSFNNTLIQAMMGEGKNAIQGESMQLPIEPDEALKNKAKRKTLKTYLNPLSNTDFEKIDELPHKFKAPLVATKFESFLGHMNISFDPHYKSNIPYVNYDIDVNEKSVRCLRIGTPTIQTHPWSTRINPEFKAFLQAYKMVEKKHVYFSLQKGKSSGHFNSFGNEKTRTDAIKKLGEGEFAGTLTVIVLDQDSSFYQQKGEHGSATMPSEEFIETFHRKMTSGEDPSFFIPPSLMEEHTDFYDKMKSLMWQLHKTMHPGKEALTVDERKDFIEIYYAAFELLVIKTLGVDSFNASCKDAIDRGGKNNALLLKVLQILTNKDQDKENAQALKTTGLAASLLVRFRTVLKKHERRKRLVDPMEKLNIPQTAEQFRKGFQNAEGLFGIDPEAEIRFHENPAIEYKHPLET